MPELFRTSECHSCGDFQHSKQCKYKEKYLSKFSKAHKRKQTSLLAKVNSRCFFPISGRHVGVPQKGTSKKDALPLRMPVSLTEKYNSHLFTRLNNNTITFLLSLCICHTSTFKS